MEIIFSTTLILLIVSLIANVCYHSTLKKGSNLYNKLKKEYGVLQSTLDEVNKDYIILQDRACNLEAYKIIYEYEEKKNKYDIQPPYISTCEV